MINFIESNHLISEKLTSSGICKILKTQIIILITKVIVKFKKIFSVFSSFLLLLKYSALSFSTDINSKKN